MALTSRDKFALAAVVTGALAIRLIFVLLVWPMPVSDFGWYFSHATAIAQGHGYSTNGFPTAYWPAGWPFFLAGEIALFGKSPLAIEIIQALLNALTVGVVYVMARRVAGTATATAAASAYAVLPSAIEWSSAMGSEPLYTLLWAVVVYIWMSRSQNLGWLAVSGLLLGAAALVRPGALLSWVVLSAYLLTLPGQRKRPARLLLAVATTVACASIAIAPLAVRNYHAFHKFVAISNNGGVTFYLANNPRPARHDLGGSPEEDEIQKLIDDPRTEAQGNELAAQLGIKFMIAHPLREAHLLASEVKGLYQGDHGVVPFTFGQIQSPPSSAELTQLSAFNDAAYYLFMILAVFGLVVCCTDRKKADPSWRLLAGMILYNTALFAVFGGNDRYRYPTMPFFAVFTGVGIIVVLTYVRARITNRGESLPKAALTRLRRGEPLHANGGRIITKRADRIAR